MKIKIIKPTEKPETWRYYSVRKNASGQDVEVKDPEILEYIEAMRIPPAWRDVWVDTSPDAVQIACGVDARGRQQCMYSQAHIKRARAQKYCDLITFGEKLPYVQRDISGYLRSGRWSKNKIIAIILRIVMSCAFRLGTLKYEQQNSTYGVTTLRREHVSFSRDGKECYISFVGKKSVVNECAITINSDPELVRAMRELWLEPKDDDHLMKYHISGTGWVQILHTDVNDFLGSYGANITSKDFRTFTSNILLIDLLQEGEAPNQLTPPARKRKMNAAIKEVALLVHNTKAVCQKDYIDPRILQLYMEHPIKYRSLFITGTVDTRVRFINWLKSHCQ